METKADNQEAECLQASEALSAHFDGAANEAETQLATAHLAHCSACAQLWRGWQSLRLMEQRALEPVASGEMLPLAPVKVPRHLKSAILRQTVASPIWQRFWPRLLTGMAVPTFVVACWLLIVATPWQQSIQEMSSQQNPIVENRVAIVPDNTASTPRNVTNKNLSKGTVDRPEVSYPTGAPKSILAPTANDTTSRLAHQAGARSDSIAPRIQRATRVTTATSKALSTKSTFKTVSPSQTLIMKPARISMASYDRPRSRAAKSVSRGNVKPLSVFTPKPRATEPVLIAYLPTQDMRDSTDASSDPMLNYIVQNDVRPDDIRLAVENYRAALLEDGSNL